jgi:hypothetical protein
VSGTGLLQVAVVPWAEVRIDGELIGTTPIDKIPLGVGTHLLQVRHPDYEPLERRVAIQKNKTLKVVINLRSEGVRKKR